jgi:hypothetical protein
MLDPFTKSELAPLQLWPKTALDAPVPANASMQN